MFYTVIVSRGQSKAADLADAISKGEMKAAAVLVVGLPDKEAFASALIDGCVEVDTDMEASLALKFEWVHAIGTEDASTSLSFLISAGKNLVEEINKAGGHEEYSKLMRRYGART